MSQKVNLLYTYIMTLRIQKKGKPDHPWTVEELAAGLKDFYEKHKRYPTASEVDTYRYLPSARSIERRFGGLVRLRKRLGLGDNPDFRSGVHSSLRAYTINNRAHKVEKGVFQFLECRFGREFVHREYFFIDDHRTRADFFIYDGERGFCVDVFYPSDRRNLVGCLNSKLVKYQSVYMRKYPVIFLQMNEMIEQDILDLIVKNKKKQLPEGQYLMSWQTFQSFCASRTRLKVLRLVKEARNIPEKAEH